MSRKQFKMFKNLKKISFSLGLLVSIVFGENPSISTECSNPAGVTSTLNLINHTFALMAGQHIEVGTVSIDFVDELYASVTFELIEEGWHLEEVHLWVGDNLDNYPKNKKGNPQIGHFPYVATNLLGVGNDRIHSFTILLNAFSNLLNDLCEHCLLGNSNNDPFFTYIMAHASITKHDENGLVLQGETAWSQGAKVVEKGSWATQSQPLWQFNCADTITQNFEVNVDDYGCETAFAKDIINEGKALCFIDISIYNETPFKRWGWTNGGYSELDYTEAITMEIYAGAGQCDTTKGYHVGQLNYTVSDGTISMQTIDGWKITQLHYYVGNEILPRDRNNEFTVAPGQYSFINDELNYATNYVYTFSFTGGIPDLQYGVFHFVTCKQGHQAIEESAENR